MLEFMQKEQNITLLIDKCVNFYCGLLFSIKYTFVNECFFHYVGIPYPPADIIAKCVTDTGDDRFMDADFITCTIY